MKKRRFIFGAAAALAVLSLTACSGSKKIATMKGGSVTVEDFYNQMKSGQNLQTSQSIVQQMIIGEVFEKAYGDKVKESEITKQINKAKKSVEKQGQTWKKALEQAGFTEESYKKYLKQKLAEEEGVKAHVKVTEKELKEAWKTFHPEVSAQIIKLDDKTTAESVLKDVKADGADFSKIAKEKSTDTTTKAKGGDIKFDSTATEVPEEVKTAAFALKDKQISEVISVMDMQTQSQSFYIVKMVKNKAKGNSMAPYKKQLKKIAEDAQLYSQEFRQKVYAEELKKAGVKVLDKEFEPALTSLLGDASSKKEASSKSSSKKSSSKKSSSSKETSSNTETSSTTESSSAAEGSSTASSTEEATSSSSAAE